VNRRRLLMIMFFIGSFEVSHLWAQETWTSGEPLVTDAVATSVATSPDSDAVAPVPRKRDPFWPVGYTPKVVRKIVEPKVGGVSTASRSEAEVLRIPQWEEAMRLLDIRGVSLIGRDKATGQAKYFAMVTGKFVEEGDVVSVTHGDFVYRWKVVGIGASGVSFTKLDVRKE